MKAFTQIENDVYDALLAAGLNGAELACALLVYRRTHGWHKETDTISFSQFGEATGCSRRTATTAIERLKLARIIALVSSGNAHGKPSEYRFNSSIKTWELGKISALVQKNAKARAEKRQKVGRKSAHTKERNKLKKEEPVFVEYKTGAQRLAPPIGCGYA